MCQVIQRCQEILLKSKFKVSDLFFSNLKIGPLIFYHAQVVQCTSTAALTCYNYYPEQSYSHTVRSYLNYIAKSLTLIKTDNYRKILGLDLCKEWVLAV